MQFLLQEPRQQRDNCDTDVTITYSETRTDGPCVDSYTLTRVWTATDNCGNSSTQSQLVTVQDTQDPVLANVPANITVECDAVPAAELRQQRIIAIRMLRSPIVKQERMDHVLIAIL